MKSLNAIKSDLSAVISELDQHIKNHSNKTAAHADYLEKENKELKAKLKNALKSKSAYKGLYENKRNYARRLESENRNLTKNFWVKVLPDKSNVLVGDKNKDLYVVCYRNDEGKLYVGKEYVYGCDLRFRKAIYFKKAELPPKEI